LSYHSDSCLVRAICYIWTHRDKILEINSMDYCWHFLKVVLLSNSCSTVQLVGEIVFSIILGLYSDTRPLISEEKKVKFCKGKDIVYDCSGTHLIVQIGNTMEKLK